MGFKYKIQCVFKERCKIESVFKNAFCIFWFLGFNILQRKDFLKNSFLQSFDVFCYFYITHSVIAIYFVEFIRVLSILVIFSYFKSFCIYNKNISGFIFYKITFLGITFVFLLLYSMFNICMVYFSFFKYFSVCFYVCCSSLFMELFLMFIVYLFLFYFYISFLIFIFF